MGATNWLMLSSRPAPLPYRDILVLRFIDRVLNRTEITESGLDLEVTYLCREPVHH